MNGEALIQLALSTLSCSQKDLATRLGVSPTQVSKWKKGEHMSYEMEERLRSLSQIGTQVPEFVLWTGSLEQAKKWEGLIKYLAELASNGAETGYDTYPLQDECGLLSWDTFRVLSELGTTLPKEFPEELDLNFKVDDEIDLSLLIEENPYSSLIYQIFCRLNDVYGFYAAYIAELVDDDELDLYDTSACNIEPCLLSLAACKFEQPPSITTRFPEFRRRVLAEYEEWLSVVKDRAFRAGRPLKAELLHLVYHSSAKLGHEAEAESMGFNADRPHPDIYMNELLTGMRIVHQVLPAILKKLGIDFELDSSELRIK